MSDRSGQGATARDAAVRLALTPVATLLALGISVVFAHTFLESKPFKLMQPSGFSTLLAAVGVASAVGSVVLSWRLLRRFPYAIPIAAVAATVLAHVLVPALLLWLFVGGSGEGDFGWKTGVDTLRLLAGGVVRSAALMGVATGLIAFFCGLIWSPE